MKIGWLAGWYRWIEYAAFGAALERRRFAHLQSLAGAHEVLILGEGDGRTLARLLHIAPTARFEVVEASPEMIRLEKRRANHSSRVHYRCGDAAGMSWQAHRFDAIVTHFFLDCFTQAEAGPLIHRLTDSLAPDGIWLIAEFEIPRNGWPRIHAQAWIWLMYRFFRLATGLRPQTLPPIAKLLNAAGMKRIEREETRAGMLISEAWERP
jgi:ubiquinone/menaquinone biosynthesis C-methylase UbiE